MEVQFTPEQQARLAKTATRAGTLPDRPVVDVVARYLDHEREILSQFLTEAVLISVKPNSFKCCDWKVSRTFRHAGRGPCDSSA